MNYRTYRLLSVIPFAGSILKSHAAPLALHGSMERESGLADEIGALVSDYLKTHPDEQVTRQLIDRLLAEERKNQPVERGAAVNKKEHNAEELERKALEGASAEVIDRYSSAAKEHIVPP